MRTKPRWSLQDAKAQFSEVVRRSLAEGPQIVSKNGEDAVVVVSVKDFDRLKPVGGASLAKMLAASPLADVSLDIQRPRGTGRVVKL